MNNNFLPYQLKKNAELNSTLASQMAGKVSSSNIENIRDNANVFEYSMDGLSWKQVISGGNTTDFGVSVKSNNASGSSVTAFGSISSGSNQLNTFSVQDFQINQGIYVLHAGAACTLTVPTGLSVTPTGTAGTTTYQYQIIALDALGGNTAATTTVQTTTGNATLSATNYNALSWTAVTGATGYAIYGRVSGNMQLLDCVYNATTWNDTGASAKGGAFYVPTSPPASQVNNSLVTTVTGGVGTSTLTLASNASATVSSVRIYHDDTAAIQSALNSNSSVQIPTGNYYVSSTLNVPMYTKVNLANQNTFIKPIGNFNVVQIGSYTEWNGGTIDYSVMSTYFTKAGLYVYPNYTNSGSNYAQRSLIQNVKIMGYSQAGTGILLDAPQVSSGNPNIIQYCMFNNIWIVNTFKALHLRSVQTTGTISSWINANAFDKFMFENNLNNIYFEGRQTDYNAIDANTFTNFQMQPMFSTSQYMIYCTGQNNVFKGMIWDLNSIFSTTQINNEVVIAFTSTSRFNRIETNVDNSSPYYVDYGYRNEWKGYGHKSEAQHPMFFPNSIHRMNPVNHKRTGYIGDQDDVLAYALKRGATITNLTTPSRPIGYNASSDATANVWDYIFSPNGDDYIDIDMTTGEFSNATPFQFVIDLSGMTPIKKGAIVGISFTGNGYQPKTLKMEYDNGNGTWNQMYSRSDNYQYEIWGEIFDYTVTRLRFSMALPPTKKDLEQFTGESVQVFGYNNHVRINRIFMVANGEAGKTHLKSYNPVIYGGITRSISTVSANYTITKDDSTLLGNATSAAITLTLPDATTMKGREYVIKKVDSSANAVTIATTSSQTIDGATTQSLSTQWGKMKVQSDGVNWQTI